MHILPHQRSTPARAVMRSAYLMTDGYCIEVYHMITGSAVLILKTRGEDYMERNITSTSVAKMVNLLQWLHGNTFVTLVFGPFVFFAYGCRI